MRIALAQINSTVGDIEGNLRRALNAYSQARTLAADLVVFPELALSGYPPEDLLYRDDFVLAAMSAAKTFAMQTTKCAALIGLPMGTKPATYNAVAFCHNGQIQGSYYKRNLPNYSVFDEKRYFSQPITGQYETPGLFSFHGFHIGVTICEDAWVENTPMFRQAEMADVLINVSASPYEEHRLDVREDLLSDIAKHVETPIVYVNLVGGQDELIFDGGSMVIDKYGQMLALAPQFQEALTMVTLDLEDASSDDGPITNPPGLREAEVFNALVLATRDYVRKNRFHRVLIGESGGIDSALVSAIAAEAVGADNVTAVLMPSRYSSPGSLDDAWTLVQRLGLRGVEIPIEGPHAAFEHLLEPVYEGLFPLSPVGVAEENLQARLRGNILMALSNKSGGLVLTTGNKSEMSMGYATLYGDMAGGFAVIKDVPKTLVFSMCEWLNTFYYEGEVIPAEILTKPPSAELRPDQKDTDSLPEYDILDPIIDAYVVRDMSPEDIAKITLSGKNLDLELVKKVCRAIDRNEHKRRQAPPGPRVTSKAFGRDRRLPISNGWL